MSVTDPDSSIVAVKRVTVSPTKDAVVQAFALWQQHTSWCRRCGTAKPGCELGRKAYDLYEWLALSRIPKRRAG